MYLDQNLQSTHTVSMTTKQQVAFGGKFEAYILLTSGPVKEEPAPSPQPDIHYSSVLLESLDKVLLHDIKKIGGKWGKSIDGLNL